ncbi:hypothetical protein AXG93_3253s1110 [Marchantia polymorpha subsp. ruderalis]|nr:hypothetical protein AXG93_3253s1110 [Marchantia polymorpha subsp. ruderalis]
MAQLRSMLLLCASLASLLIGSSASLSLVPAFVWSNTRNVDDRSITYQTFSSESVVEQIMSEFSSPLLQEQAPPVDFVLAFIGNKLRSVEVSRAVSSPSDLVPVIQGAVANSKSSFAIPYVTPLKRENTFAKLLDLASADLMSADKESNLGDVVVAGSCASETTGAKKYESLEELEAYLTSKKEQGSAGKADLIIVCSQVQSSFESKQPLSEGEVMGAILKTLEDAKAKYVASYVTDLVEENVLALSKRRQLGTKLRVSNETFCDGLCQTKATMLEGLFVAITLLIILISGICCMAGITTPNRFETAKDS